MRRSRAIAIPSAAGAAHADTADGVTAALLGDCSTGLTAAEASRRLAFHGANRITTARRSSLAVLLLRQFADPLVGLLVAAAAISAAIGDELEAVVAVGEAALVDDQARIDLTCLDRGKDAVVADLDGLA